MMGLIGKKVGMTQLFNEKGDIIPVTVIEAGPCTVTEVRSAARDRSSGCGITVARPRLCACGGSGILSGFRGSSSEQALERST